LINSFNSINKPVELEKRGAGSIVSTIGGSIAKGAASGFAAGSAIPGIGNAIGTIGGAILGLAGGIGSSINGNNYEKIKKAQELAYNNSLNNFNTQVLNTTKQNNLNSLVNMTALGGQLNYNIDNKYLANDYMSKLNNRVYKP
jgi:phage tail tape-measure protein